MVLNMQNTARIELPTYRRNQEPECHLCYKPSASPYREKSQLLLTLVRHLLVTHLHRHRHQSQRIIHRCHPVRQPAPQCGCTQAAPARVATVPSLSEVESSWCSIRCLQICTIISQMITWGDPHDYFHNHSTVSTHRLPNSTTSSRPIQRYSSSMRKFSSQASAFIYIFLSSTAYTGAQIRVIQRQTVHTV